MTRKELKQAILEKIALKTEELELFDATQYITEEDFEEFFNDCTPDFMGIYKAADVLKKVDPIAYRGGYFDFVDSHDWTQIKEYKRLVDELEELKKELEELEELEELDAHQ